MDPIKILTFQFYALCSRRYPKPEEPPMVQDGLLLQRQVDPGRDGLIAAHRVNMTLAELLA